MDYIIENANILKENRLDKYSILVRENRIAALLNKVSQYKLMKMNAEPYVMTPAFVLLDTKIPYNRPFQEIKKYMRERFLLRGCTTLITYVKLSYEDEINKKINEMKAALMSIPIDFIIGVRIPLRLLTPAFVRNCKREFIPAIFVEIENLEELDKIPWGWVREALFPFNSPLIPIFSPSLKQESKYPLAKWKVIIQKEKLPALLDELEEEQPLSVSVLNKIGLYPQIGSLMHGMELSYNLYLKKREIKKVDELNLFHYHSDSLVVTVHNGKVIRAGKEVLFKPGNGKYVKIRTPSYFTL